MVSCVSRRETFSNLCHNYHTFFIQQSSEMLCTNKKNDSNILSNLLNYTPLSPDRQSKFTFFVTLMFILSVGNENDGVRNGTLTGKKCCAKDLFTL